MFKKGVSGNPAGRESGTTTTRVRLMRELAEMIVIQPGVQTKLLEQALARQRAGQPRFGRPSGRDLLQAALGNGSAAPSLLKDGTTAVGS